MAARTARITDSDPTPIQVAPANVHRWDEPTPLCTYVPDALSEDSPGCQVIRIEPTCPRDRDDTPAYVFPPEGFTPPASNESLRFGAWLIRRGLIDRRLLFTALARSRVGGCRIGDALVQLGILDRARVEEEATAFCTFTAFQGAEPLAGPCPGD
jgi:hypothetical protein